MRNAPRQVRLLLIDEDHRWIRSVLPELEPYFTVVVTTCDRSAVQALGQDTFDVVVTGGQIGMRKAEQVRALIGRLAPGLEERTIYTTCGGFDPALRSFFEQVRSPVLYKNADAVRLRNAIYALAQQAAVAA